MKPLIANVSNLKMSKIKVVFEIGNFSGKFIDIGILII